MDKRLEQKITEKIQQTITNVSEVNTIVKSLGHNETKDFKYGIIIGRLYNSFYYQSRRILKRDPTENEFLEFLEILSKRKNELVELL